MRKASWAREETENIRARRKAVARLERPCFWQRAIGVWIVWIPAKLVSDFLLQLPRSQASSMRFDSLFDEAGSVKRKQFGPDSVRMRKRGGKFPWLDFSSFLIEQIKPFCYKGRV